MLARVGGDFLPFSIPFYAAPSLISSVSVDTGPKRVYSRKESAGLSDFFAITMVVVWISARTRARVTFESPCIVKVMIMTSVVGFPNASHSRGASHYTPYARCHRHRIQ